MTSDEQPAGPDTLLRVTVTLAFIGLLGVMPLLWFGFTPTTMGIGMVMGFPELGLSIILYCAAVVRDLRRTGLL